MNRAYLDQLYTLLVDLEHGAQTFAENAMFGNMKGAVEEMQSERASMQRVAELLQSAAQYAAQMTSKR